ncbi:MAG: hypothetical protein RIC16_08080 [Rhodospirillales bacterium]
MAKSTKRKTSSTRRTETDQAERLIAALFAAAERHGWRKLTMSGIADEAGCSLKDALAVSPTRYALLGKAIQQADRKALGEMDGFTDDDTVRDRLFALLMARFDAILPHRDGVRAILCGGICDPGLHATIAVQGLCSMSRMLEAAGLSASGPIGLARAKGLALVNANALRVWLDDDSDDLAKTMVALDKGLARAESVALSLDPLARRRSDDTTGKTA